LTVAHLIDPSILTLKDYYVQIETSGEFTAGESVGYAYAPARLSPPMNNGLPAPETAEAEFKANTRVAVGVDSEKFFRLLLPRLTTAS
jgi:inosine-uridine nucleoside N-ribohydrolase